ncbi:hypothetical protein CsSME_00039944 [Camellia sinensis var. sinensis]
MLGSEDNDPNGDNKSSSSFDLPSSVACSICLDLVTDNGDRSRAKLQCGHEFHLDCIGSAFNMKGAMQCPNCRKVERGRWLYASGSACSFPEFSMDEWIPDEDPYELSYSEMPLSVHWCPFSGLARVHSSFEPLPPASSNTNESEDPNFNHHWNGISGHNEIFTAHGFPVIDVQYQTWGHHSHPFSTSSAHSNSTDQASVPPPTLRSSRGEYDAMTRSGSFAHPFPYGHGNNRPHERIQTSHAIHHQQHLSNPTGIPSPAIPGVRRFNGPRGLPPLVPPTSQSDHTGGFFIFPPPPGSSGQNLHEAENSLLNRIHVWERDRSSHLPVNSFDRDSGRGSFHHPASGSDSGNSSASFWHNRH